MSKTTANLVADDIGRMLDVIGKLQEENTALRQALDEWRDKALVQQT